ncbi:hypothetical protein Ahy_B09g095337 [Arachis hypogaea]|uniref:CCHC-type domain-containing protein n=1 Tax=Arachis hypogaea TaxID=3818 RepID=A0A444XDJ8_ARAHY|nr:hypothetical protein Ahy_B09g095337 [Arachis hypogaea]
MHHSQPVKTPTTMHPQPKKPTSQPIKVASQPSKPNKPYSQPTKPTYKPTNTTSQPIKISLQSPKLHPQQTKTNLQGKTVPPHSKTSSQPAKNSESNKNKGNSSACRVTRSGRCVREGPIQEEDYDSHDSYESTEDELYKPPKVLGDNLYSSDSDNDSEKGSPRKQKKAEAREKHRPPKSRLGDKEIDTDDSSYKGFEDEESSESASVPPPVKPKPRRPTKKRRDKKEQPSGSNTKMKRKYNPIRCMYCGEVGHNKRVVAPAAEGAEPELNAASTDADNGTEVEAPLSSLPSPIQSPSEIDISQSESIPPTQDTQQDQLVGRPPKLQVIKRKARLTSSPKPTATGSVAVSAETIKGTSSGITKRLANFMSFVPTPSFKAPRKNDDKGIASNFK